MKLTIFMDMDALQKVLAVEERLKSRPKKRMKPNDPQSLRVLDGSCLCGCRSTLVEGIVSETAKRTAQESGSGSKKSTG